jgi:hypothetical protein
MSIVPSPPGEPGRDLLEKPTLPSGSLNDTYEKYERPSTNSKPGGRLSKTSATSTPRLMRLSRAASMFSTASISLSADPGSAAVRPLPKWIEHCERDGVNCTPRMSSPAAQNQRRAAIRGSDRKRFARSTSETGNVTTSSRSGTGAAPGASVAVSVLTCVSPMTTSDGLGRLHIHPLGHGSRHPVTEPARGCSRNRLRAAQMRYGVR